ncbi:pyrimidine dimer DNA glycosylase/endonuclease V [Candidatus Zixiibacteriota bacterium]
MYRKWAIELRIWSLHPKYLDPRGLVSVWREGLLAQAVLLGNTKGYQQHPQLIRFRQRPSPVGSIADYLRAIHAESLVRGYRFEALKINSEHDSGTMHVTRGQIQYEWEHLMAKLGNRNRAWQTQLEAVQLPRPHPLFRVVPGDVEEWERVVGATR